MSDIDLSNLKRLAEAARDADGRRLWMEFDAFENAFTPAVALALIARVQVAEAALRTSLWALKNPHVQVYLTAALETVESALSPPNCAP